MVGRTEAVVGVRARQVSQESLEVQSEKGTGVPYCSVHPQTPPNATVSGPTLGLEESVEPIIDFFVNIANTNYDYAPNILQTYY